MTAETYKPLAPAKGNELPSMWPPSRQNDTTISQEVHLVAAKLSNVAAK